MELIINNNDIYQRIITTGEKFTNCSKKNYVTIASLSLK